MLEKALASLLDCKEIKPVNSKRNQTLIFIGRTESEAEAPLLWLRDMKVSIIVIIFFDWEQLNSKFPF